MRYALLSVLLATRLSAECPAAWGYAGTNGPENWGQMKAEWAECDAGNRQAPIDISNVTFNPYLPNLAFSYPAMPVTVQNTGHDLKVLPLGEATFEGRPLVQFHFHVPSEHTLNGRTYAAEAHFVHADKDGGLYVAAVFIEESTSVNAALQQLLDTNPAQCGSKKLAAFSVSHLLPVRPLNEKYAKYDGSLTVPPCAQPVTFFVFQQPIRATAAQITGLKVSGHDNVRPLQPRGDRSIVANFNLPD